MRLDIHGSVPSRALHRAASTFVHGLAARSWYAHLTFEEAVPDPLAELRKAKDVPGTLEESARFLRQRSDGLGAMQPAARECLDTSLQELRASVSGIAADLGGAPSMVMPKALLEILGTVGIAFDPEAAYDGSEMDYDLDKVGDTYRAKLLDVIHAAQRGDPAAYTAAQVVHGEAQRIADASDRSESEREAAREVMRVARKLIEATKPRGA